MNGAKLIGSGIAALALAVGATLWWLNHHTLKAAPLVLPYPDQTAASSAAALQENVNRLQAEHTRLADSLASMRAENARLAKVKEQAEHAARLFKELGEQSGAQGQDPTNSYPTPRHVLAGTGKQARLMAEVQAKWGDADEDKMPLEERQAMMQAGMVVAAEFMRLKQMVDQMDDKDREAFLNPTTPEAMADYTSCYLYGALELDAGQFSSINGILQRYCQQAAEEHLLQPIPGESAEAAANRIAALNQLNEVARAEIHELLMQPQAAILDGSAFKGMKLVTAKFHPPGFQIGVRMK